MYNIEQVAAGIHISRDDHRSIGFSYISSTVKEVGYHPEKNVRVYDCPPCVNW